MEKVYVLEMIAALNFGGSQAMIVNLVKAMNNNNVQCDFIVDHPEYDGLRKIVEDLGCKVYEVPAFKVTNIGEVKKAWNDLFETHPEYKVLHSHSRSYASIYIPIAKKHGLKTIIHSHNTSNGKGLSSVLKALLQYPLRKQADYFIGCSLEAGRWLFGEEVIKQDNFSVLNNAIDTDKFTYNYEIREKYRRQFNLKDEKVFIQVGRLDDQKNHVFMLDTFKEYLKSNPSDKLFIVGNGVNREKIDEKIEKLGIGKNIVILEKRNDVNCLLQMADVFVMPSLFEGLSVAAIEAQASGISCIMSDKVNNDVNITGLCRFIPLYVNRWVEEMSKPLELRRKTKKEIVEHGFDVKTTAKWLEDLYIELGK
ncbi:MAG: glycosyltransferase [Erysipelotrichaceae bacterium]|nr:glycosyltransferase [Erysipelotrichaceae bacterium]